LALIAVIPVVAFGVLDLNNAWNDMFVGTALTILSIAAARMYRSLSDRGPITGYVYALPMSNHELLGRSQSRADSSPFLRTPHLPRFSPGASDPTALFGGTGVHGPIHIQVVSTTQSEGTQTTYSAKASPQTDEIQVKFAPGGSASSFAHDSTPDKSNSAANEMI